MAPPASSSRRVASGSTSSSGRDDARAAGGGQELTPGRLAVLFLPTVLWLLAGGSSYRAVWFVAGLVFCFR